MTGGQIRFDTGPLGDGTLFRAPQAIIRADSAAGVGPALAAMQAATERGCWLAGYLSYELGHALIPRLAGLMPADRQMPLILMGVFDGPHPADPLPSPDGVAIGAVRPLWDRARYDAAIAAVHGLIESGDTYQINLTFPLQAEVEGDPLAIYAALAARQPVGEGAFVDLGGPVVLSRSPELFFAVDADRRITTRPMKGTAARGDTPANDAQAAQALHGSAKNRAENLMIVDLLRNDLARVAEAGSVRVENAFAVETYPTVHQMVSTVRARLAEGAGPMELLTALFPCGSITGAPKIRAMELLAGIERDARGAYCGAIGRIGPPDAAGDGGGEGDAAFNVAIRTLRLTEIENRRGTAELGVGGAIVADSEALPEWREALTKGAFARASSPIWRAPAVDLVETMRFEPASGIAALEAHMQRMRDSAAVLGVSFDRHEARNQIHALCFDLETPSTIRMMASRSGALALEARPLPDPWPDPAQVIVLPLPVDPGDWRLQHKTSDRGFYDDARRVAADAGAQEAIFLRDDGLVTEGAITSIFVADGEGGWLTPPVALGLLPGVLRGQMIASGEAREAELTLADLEGGFMLGNALRGLMPARLMA